MAVERTDKRPSDYEYARLSSHVYGSDVKIRAVLQIDSPFGPQKWRVRKVLADGYSFFAALYHNADTNHFVVAFKGTDSFSSFIEDLRGVFFNTLSPQKESAFGFTKEAVLEARDSDGTLSFTGHSLGAYLAELSLFYCFICFEPEADELDLRKTVHAVTFESPGTSEVMEKLQSHNSDNEIPIKSLDITCYLSYPNLVNTCNGHGGTVYSLAPDVGKRANIPLRHLKQVHSMDRIVTLFESSQDWSPERVYMQDWPLGSQRNYFFEQVRLEDGKYVWSAEEKEVIDSFNLPLRGHFRIDKKLSSYAILPLRHCSEPMQTWLRRLFSTVNLCLKHESLLHKLKTVWEELGVPSNISSILLFCELMQNPYKVEYLEYAPVADASIKTATGLRRELSSWLAANPELAAKMLLIPIDWQKNPTIKAQLLAKGAILDETGLITNPEVVAIHTSIPLDTSEEMIHHFERVVETLLGNLEKHKIDVVAQLAAPGAIIKGQMDSPKVHAISLQVGAAPKANSQVGAAPKANSQVGAAPKANSADRIVDIPLDPSSGSGSSPLVDAGSSSESSA